ncbi:hypothetical protein BGZ83_003302 [Gryganskiella cystojenkinii]|nr:hypothetical protein BGZ83_003302 [Gryganskiella cystojenkinii]
MTAAHLDLFEPVPPSLNSPGVSFTTNMTTASAHHAQSSAEAGATVPPDEPASPTPVLRPSMTSEEALRRQSQRGRDLSTQVHVPLPSVSLMPIPPVSVPEIQFLAEVATNDSKSAQKCAASHPKTLFPSVKMHAPGIYYHVAPMAIRIQEGNSSVQAFGKDVGFVTTHIVGILASAGQCIAAQMVPVTTLQSMDSTTSTTATPATSASGTAPATAATATSTTASTLETTATVSATTAAAPSTTGTLPLPGGLQFHIQPSLVTANTRWVNTPEAIYGSTLLRISEYRATWKAAVELLEPFFEIEDQGRLMAIVSFEIRMTHRPGEVYKEESLREVLWKYFDPIH